MNLSELGFLLAGACCVALGVVSAAIADRIRGIRRERSMRTRARATNLEPALTTTETDAMVRMGADVVATLVTSGFPRASAAAAVADCAGSERATVESWTRAALRRIHKGAAS